MPAAGHEQAVLRRRVNSNCPFGALRLLRAIRRAVWRDSVIWRVSVLDSPAAGHEQAKRVEWLPDMDSNHD
jgi:hypothetical protein